MVPIVLYYDFSVLSAGVVFQLVQLDGSFSARTSEAITVKEEDS